MGLSIYCTFVSTHKVLNFEIYDEVLLSNLTEHFQNDITYLISSTQVHAHFYTSRMCVNILPSEIMCGRIFPVCQNSLVELRKAM